EGPGTTVTDVAKDLTCESVEEGDFVSRYVTDQLPEADAEAFERHYLGCDRCSAEIQAALEIRASLAAPAASQKPSPTPAARVVSGPWTNWRLLAAAAAVVVAVAGALILIPGRRDPVARLIAAATELRVVEARLAGGFEYAPFSPVTRGAESPPTKPSWRLLSAAAEAEKRAAERPTARALATVGLAHLLLRDWDQAVSKLQQAASMDPKDPELLADLSAAYYGRGSQGRS